MKKLKDDKYRIGELENSLKVIEKSFNEFYVQREWYILLPILSQLRSLVAMTSNKNNHPLLIDLIDKFTFSENIYSFQPLLAPNTALYTYITNKSWSLTNNGYISQKYSLKEWLNTPFTFIYDENRNRKMGTRNDVIRNIGDKEGGGHYDPDIAEYMEILKWQTFGNKLDGVSLFLLDISSAVLYIGKMFLLDYKIKNNTVNKTEHANQVMELKNYFETINFTGVGARIDVHGEFV